MGTQFQEQDPAHRLMRLLIVEDNPADVGLEVALLKRAGYPLTFETVDNAADFQQALERGNYDLILCDHNLLSWNGMEALEILKNSRKDVPFLVVTATLGDEAAVDYIKQGAADYVLKHRLKRLPVAVRQALREKAHRDESARLNEQIMAGKRQWELTFDSVPAPIMLLNVSGEVTRANQSAVDLAGKKFSEVIGRPCWEVLPCNDYCPEKCPYHQTIETGRFSRREELVSAKERLLECMGNPLCDPSGGLSGTVIVLHDLTERRRAEAATRQLAAIVESSEDAIIGKTLDGIIRTWNRGAEKQYGYTAEEVVGQPVSKLAPPEAGEEIRRILERVRHGESVQPYETVRVRKDGTQFPVSVTVSPVLDAHGEVAGAATIARDISERKRAEERLQESELRFRQIAETISEVFWMADPRITRMLYVSPGYERLWGRSCASLYENPNFFLEAIHPQDRERVLTTLKAQKTGRRFDHEYRIVLPDGSVRWVWDRGFPVCDGSGNVTSYVGVAQDITKRKKAELALADQLEELHRWHEAMLEREGRLLDLKREINELLKQNGNPPRYPSAEQKGA